MKRKLLTVILTILAASSLMAATLSFAFAADTAQTSVYSYNLAINGDFEESEPIGASIEFAEKYDATHYFGNFFSGYNLGAGIFHTNQKALENVSVTQVSDEGVNGSKAIKVVYNGIGDGFAYRMVNNQALTVLTQPGKTYSVSVQHKVDVDKNPCGPQLTLNFFMSDGSVWETKSYVIHPITWGHTANVWETISGTFRYDLTEEGGVKTCTVTHTNTEGGISSDSFTYAEIAYVDMVFACYVGGEATNEIYYDNFIIEEMYEAKVQVTNEDAEPIDNIADKFTVNGESVTPVYDNGMYIFKNLTGENEIELVDDSLNLVTSNATVYGDKSVFTEITGDGFWASYAASEEPRSILFGVPLYQDITVNIKDNADSAVTGAVIDAGDYTVEEEGDGVYTIKDVLQTAPEFTLSVKAVGYYPAEVVLDGSVASKNVTLKEVVDKSENLIINGDFENSDNLVAYNATDVNGKWRPTTEDATLSLGDDVFSGIKALNVAFTKNAIGTAYRIPADTVENGTWYSFGARTKIEHASEKDDAVYVGFVPVLKLNDGTTFTRNPIDDFTSFYQECFIVGSFPISNWVNLTGIVCVDYNSDADTFTYIINGNEKVVSNVNEVIGYDLYFIYANGDGNLEYTVNLDRVTFCVAVGYTGIDLGNDASNKIPNGDFENASTIKDSYVTTGFWTTSDQNGHLEQSGDYAKNGMSSMKAEMNTETFIIVRTECYAGHLLSSLNANDFQNVKPGVFHTIKGYVKSESVGASLSLNFMPTLFKNGTYTDTGATGTHYKNQMAAYTFTESDTLDGEWIELSATFYYTIDFATGTISAWFNKTDVSGTPDFTIGDITEFHALDISFTVDSNAVIYFDMWTLYSAYDATISVLGEDGNATTDKTLELKDYFGNDVTADYTVVIEDGAYKINGVYGPLKVSVSGDDRYPAQTVSSVRTERTLQMPFSYTVTVKGADNQILNKNAIQVSVKQEGADTGVITWNDNGSFTISGLTGTNITVTVIAEGYKNGNITINGQGEQEIALQLDVKPVFNAIITVKDSENNPISSAKVEIKRGNEVIATATSGRNGTYTLIGLNDDVEGDLVVVVTLDGYTFETGKTVYRGASTVQITGTLIISEDVKSGCGSVAGSASVLISFAVLAGAALLTAKKKK